MSDIAKEQAEWVAKGSQMARDNFQRPDMSENDIKPVAWISDDGRPFKTEDEARRNSWNGAMALYDQQDIDSLLEKIDRLEMIEGSWLEFMEKTEWVQKSSDPGELGFHRADVLKSRIDRLTAELSMATGERNRLQLKWDEFRQAKNSEAQRLTAERDAAVADAERYRWLRNPSQDVGLVLDKVVGEAPMDEQGYGGYKHYEYRAGEELDAAIDAARSEGGV